jgi:glycosyltransferase involved in cell wall biosynthesis
MPAKKVNLGLYKVLFVSAVADFKGGAEKCLVQFLQNPSVEPILIVPGYGQLTVFAEKNNIPFYVISFGNVSKIKRPLKISSSLYALRDAISISKNIMRLASELQVDCIHSNGLKTHGILALSNLFTKTPVICHIHDIPYTLKERLFWWFLFLLTNKLLLVSEFCSGSLNINSEKINVIPNGLAVSKGILNVTELPDVIRIGFIGRIHPNKGLHIALNWLVEAKSAGINFVFSIRGEAAENDADYLSSIKQYVVDNNLSDCCSFEGKVEDYDELYKDLDVVVMPSIIDEPFGLVAIESFEQGVPCIAYPSGALPKIIVHGQSGFLCRTGEEFILSFTQLFSDLSFYNTTRLNAYNRVLSEFSLDSLYVKLNDVYSSIKTSKKRF